MAERMVARVPSRQDRATHWLAWCFRCPWYERHQSHPAAFHAAEQHQCDDQTVRSTVEGWISEIRGLA